MDLKASKIALFLDATFHMMIAMSVQMMPISQIIPPRPVVITGL